MSDIRLIFIILNISELLIFCVFGYILSKVNTKTDYWVKALVPILAYSVFTGLYFGRAINWNICYFIYTGLGSDQVWRTRYFGQKIIGDAYLAFARVWDIKRIAFAASFGTDEWEYTKDQQLSVRS